MTGSESMFVSLTGLRSLLTLLILRLGGSFSHWICCCVQWATRAGRRQRRAPNATSRYSRTVKGIKIPQGSVRCPGRGSGQGLFCVSHKRNYSCALTSVFGAVSRELSRCSVGDNNLPGMCWCEDNHTRGKRGGGGDANRAVTFSFYCDTAKYCKEESLFNKTASAGCRQKQN